VTEKRLCYFHKLFFSLL